MNELDRWAHPRSRGENPIDTESSDMKAGSSPLTRGKHRVAEITRERRGLIPAHAGKTSSVCIGLRVCGAHPRSRGENHPYQTTCKTAPGSSPLTRGKRIDDRRQHIDQRLIPAHAGKTVPSPTLPHHAEAHPRSRGENIMEQTADAHGAGSSPLTRGKPRGRKPRA